MIRLENVSFQYLNTEEKALRNVSLSIHQGEFVVLLGSSGCGKTTLTRLINRLVPEFYEGTLEGKVYIDGKDTDTQAIQDLTGTVGSVFQDPRSQFFAMDTTEEIAFSCENIGMPREEIHSRVEEAANLLQIQNLLDRDIFSLSSGEKQAIAIASVYALRPHILVLDEPSANLDNQAVDHLRRILKILKSQGYTIVISEHRIHYLKELADRAVLLDHGQIVREIPGDTFRKLSDTEANRMGLRSMNMTAILPAIHEDLKTAEHLQAEDLSFGYERGSALWSHVSFPAPRGAVIGIIGENGAGKTTFLSVLCGLKKESAGRIKINGSKLSPGQRMKKTYLVMQDSDYQQFADSVEKELYLDERPDQEKKDRAAALLQELGLSEYLYRHPASLSGGQKQRLCIACACMKDAEVICFDEPTSGLDYRSMTGVSGLFKKLSEAGKTLFVVTHDYEFLMSACTHVLSMGNGGLKGFYEITGDTATEIYRTMFRERTEQK